MTIAEALAWAAEAFGGSGSSRLDAEVLLGQALSRGRAYLYTWPQAELTARQRAQFETLVDRRLSGWPIAYLIGRQEFWSLELEVSPAVLIPRPETELLVEHALLRLPEQSQPVVLDLGTGSGAVALAIAHERPRARVVAVDLSGEALELAARNARRLGITNVEFRSGDWYGAVKPGEHFDLIVSNPPYIAESEPEPGQGDSRFEPRQALITADAGLASLREVLFGACAHLKASAWVLVEHGYRQQAEVQALAAAAGLIEIETIPDLQGHPRVTLGRNH